MVVDCLPYLSDKTIPTWYVLFVFKELLGWETELVVFIDLETGSNVNMADNDNVTSLLKVMIAPVTSVTKVSGSHQKL